MPGETLEQLEGSIWPSPDYDSYLVSTVHRLRKKPLAEFTVEDLRIMIGQGVGLPHLIERAVAILERQPLAEGDFYPGDLLSSVVSAETWLACQPKLAFRVLHVAQRVVAEPGEVDPELLNRLATFIDRVRAKLTQPQDLSRD
jgi:hypothetical protein